MVEARLENGRDVVARWDQVFTAVASEPRRQVIVSLMDADVTEAVSLPEKAINPNVPVSPEKLRIDLIHKHLPELADYEFIKWNTDPLRAYRGQRFEEVAIVFEALQSKATDIPDSLVIGCQRLEKERQGIPENE